jgi:hypothetical protein
MLCRCSCTVFWHPSRMRQDTLHGTVTEATYPSSFLEVQFPLLSRKLRFSRRWGFWVMTPHIVAVRHQRFGGSCCLHLQGGYGNRNILRNIDILPQHHTASQPKRPSRLELAFVVALSFAREVTRSLPFPTHDILTGLRSDNGFNVLII